MLVALLAALALLAAPAWFAGAWDPHELDAADLGRRLAVRLFGAAGLSRAGDPDAMPTLSDLGGGELPFTSMAAALAVLGLSDVAARVASLAAGASGLLATALLVARLAGARAAAYAGLVLATTPLYALHARAAHGQALGMAAFATSIAGLGLAITEPTRRARALAALLGLGGVFAGALSVGVLFGLAAPTLSVALAALLAAPTLGTERARARRVGLGLLAVGVAAVIVYVALAWPRAGEGAPLSRWVGATLDAPSTRAATFDRLLRQLGHALFPWGALAPFALARMAAAPPRAVAPDARSRASLLRLLVLTSVGVGLVVGTATLPWSGAAPLVSTAAIAIAIGLAFDDLERGAPRSILVALGVALLAATLHLDLLRSPARALAAFTIDEAPYDAALEAGPWLPIASGGFVVGAIAAFADRRAHSRARAATGDRLRRVVATSRAALGRSVADLAAAWRGNLLFSLVLVEAALVGLAAMVTIGGGLGWPSILAMPSAVATFARHAWWVLPSAALGAVVLPRVLRAVLREVARGAGVPRSRVAFALAVAAGAGWSAGHLPAALAGLSPREVVRAHSVLFGDDAELAVLGLSPSVGPHYLGRAVPSFRDPHQAHRWLVASGAPGRALAFRSEHLPTLNALHRRQRGRQLPVVATPSSAMFLAASELGDRPSQNPLDRWLRDAPPTVAHPLGAVLDGRVEIVGWELLDERGRVVDELVAKRPHVLRVVYSVRAPLPAGYEAFFHLDGHARRHNGDHPLLGGGYPTQLWQPGDVIVDEHPFELGLSFTPGDYWLFLGLYADQTRLPVTEGEHRDDRVVAGRVRVR